MTEQKNLPSMGLIAKALRKYSGRGKLVLIGPVRIWFDQNSGRDMFGLVAITHDATHHECCFETMIYFGSVAAEPPQWLADAVDGVLLVKQGNEITASEADKLRADLIGHCRTHFKRVRVFGTERELADAMVEFFPGEKSTRLHAAIHADANSV
jgi:hypothetical protein